MNGHHIVAFKTMELDEVIKKESIKKKEDAGSWP